MGGKRQDDGESEAVKNGGGDAIDPSRVLLAPMVRGSELAFRQLVRQYGVTVCYSPMLRAAEIIKAYDYYKSKTSKKRQDIDKEEDQEEEVVLHEDGWLLLNDILVDPHPVVVQLCGNSPSNLQQATQVLLELNQHHGCQIVGIDLNLGCPQDCAKRGGFGAFLAEDNPQKACECVSAMRETIQQYTSTTCNTTRPRLSCKIRLQQDSVQTVQLAQSLAHAGCQLLTIHCRQRTDKHDGIPNLQVARDVVHALKEDSISMPIVLNGWHWKDVPHALASTGAYGVMLARDFLRNPRLLQPQQHANNYYPGQLAAEYLEFAKRHPPPSPLYMKLHLRWIFRAALEPRDKTIHPAILYANNNWKPRLWTFLARPYLTCLEQFRQVVFLYFYHSWHDDNETKEDDQTLLQAAVPVSLQDLAIQHEQQQPITFRTIRYHYNR
ncbi:dihydrouridine(20a/20b) synthase [Seminavis robusta]|uniref:tRNA-dihydrouridine(16/17) synthase [NAD(P)(+)] n=1 Tax=Seminavis robusta TaxID=568900 RepID=A0A9N8EP92_9STRA|nr:dihydrouridine(20a/20b) synthase [Seminavis robusta]|eukprot:Sro1438_g272740.1 dihydrouridine(20a/20b) synthase (437) ;mRNA; r:27894-29204